jgi:hypothetical protein
MTWEDLCKKYNVPNDDSYPLILVSLNSTDDDSGTLLSIVVYKSGTVAIKLSTIYGSTFLSLGDKYTYEDMDKILEVIKKGSRNENT